MILGKLSFQLAIDELNVCVCTCVAILAVGWLGGSCWFNLGLFGLVWFAWVWVEFGLVLGWLVNKNMVNLK